MRGSAPGDVLKVWFYAAASVLLGTWISPLFYNAGKALAEVSATKQTNGPLEWLAGHCRSADFPQFLETAVLVCAIGLFLPFIEWLRGGRAAPGERAGSLRLPDGARIVEGGQRLAKNPFGIQQAVAGFLGVAILLSLCGAALTFAGIFGWKSPGESVFRILFRVLSISLALAVVQEVLFRGIAMGIFLRAMRPSAALGMSAALFALAHLFHPTPGLDVIDPEAPGVGFALLGKIAGRFSDPRFIIGTFAPLLALGGVLAYARWKTASLWLPIGLHAGWIFANALLASVTVAPGHHDSMLWLLAGSSLHQGLVALVGIVIAGGLVIHLTSPGDVPDSPA